MHIQGATGGGSLMSLRRSLMSPELKMFMKMLKSPSHLMFVASNLAILVHLLFYSTVRRKQKMQEFMSQMDELENYINLINDLDSQNEEVQRQIAILKKFRANEDETFPSEDDQEAQIEASSDSKKFLAFSDQIHVDFANNFLKQRNFIASTFKDKKIIGELFRNSSSSPSENLQSEKATYSDPILNSLMALAHQLVKTFLVELNIKNALGDEETRRMTGLDSFLVQKDILAYMNHDLDKEELLVKLYALKRKGNTLEEDKLRISLDESAMEELNDKFGKAEAFKNKGDRRYDLYLNLSGGWLNYDQSDTFNSIQAASPPQFGSNIFNSDEYITKFNKIFSAYEKSDAPNREYALIIQLANALAAGGECVPTYSVFKCLLDNFGRIGLYNYQSMVYDVLPAFEYHQTAFADCSTSEEFAPRSAFHFEHIIENHPDFLASLVEYQIPRNNVTTFKLLLDYFEPVSPSNAHALSLIPNFARGYVSNSPSLLESKKEITIGLDTLLRTVKSCVEIKEYSALDKLLNKLLLNLIQTGNGVRVVLNSIKDEGTLICNAAPSLAPSLLFTEEILVLLARAYVETNDRVRAKWLLPHVKTFLNANYSPDLRSFLPSMMDITANKVTETIPADAFASKPIPSVSMMA